MTPKRWLWLLILLSVSSPGLSKISERIRYRMQVFRITGGFRRDLSLNKPIWKGRAEDWDKIKESVQLFDQGKFCLGKNKLEINHKGCFWNRERLTFASGHKKGLAVEQIKMIYSPNIMRKAKQPVRMKISSEQPFQYLDQREDGLFALKEMHLPVGLDIEITAEDKGNDVFLISAMNLILRTVTEREKVPGVNLPIGRPILHTSEYALKLFIQESRSYGILLRPPGSGAIIIRIELDDD